MKAEGLELISFAELNSFTQKRFCGFLVKREERVVIESAVASAVIIIVSLTA